MIGLQIDTMPNGNLSMYAAGEARASIARMRDKQTSAAEIRFVKRFLTPLGYRVILPEDCGALTSATCITKGDDVWADMSYQVVSMLETLATGGKVVWTKG